MSLAFVFPGQGTQAIGMGKDLFEAFESFRKIFDQLDQWTDIDISKICFEGPIGHLTDSRISGLAVFAVSVGIFELLKEHRISPSVFSGYSIGHYAALYSAGYLGLKECYILVDQRGKCLERAAQKEPSGMVGVIGIPADKIVSILEQTGDSYIANFNCPGNMTISHSAEIKDKLYKELKSANPLHLIPIDVAGGWHSPFMRSAADDFAPIVDRVEFLESENNFVDDYSAKLENSIEQIQRNLLPHIHESVKWHQSVKRMEAMGINDFVEVGFGNQLCKFIKFSNRKLKVHPTGTELELKKTIGKIKSL